MARPNQEIRVWEVQNRSKSKGYAKRPWRVPWKVDGRRFQRMHRTRRQANNFRARLLVAQQNGERFDPATGEPESWTIEHTIGCTEWVRRYLAEQWDEWAPRSRRSAVEEMSRFLPLLIKTQAPPPDIDLRRYLVTALAPGAERDPGVEAWLAKWNYALTELDRSILADVVQQLGYGINGKLLSNTTANRYRSKSHSCIRRAVDLELLERDPWPPQQRGAKNRKVRQKAKAVDIRQLPDPATMHAALNALLNHQPASHMYYALTSTVAYSGLRPSEAVMLRPRALTLPVEGWGRIEVAEADDGFDEPGDPKTGDRSVPIPPILVTRLTSWLNDNPHISNDDLLFRTRNNNRPSPSNWGRAWHRALAKIDYPRLRIYDCRHTAATTWLRGGVPLAEVARRMGHSVETLVEVYVGALDGDEQAANTLIDAQLEGLEPLPPPTTCDR